MDAKESLRLSTRALRSHKLRSALTVVGIVIGIAAVVTFVTLGASVKADVVGQIDQSAANNIYLLSSPEGEDVAGPAGPVYTERDIEAVRGIEGVEYVVPQGTVSATVVRYENSTVPVAQQSVGRGPGGTEATVTATTPAAFERATFIEGEAFESGAGEMVINEQAQELFDAELSVGDTVSLTLGRNETRTVTVVGVVNRTGSASPLQTFSQQPRFYVPADPFYDRYVQPPDGAEQRAYSQVTVVANPAAVTATQDRIEKYLNESDAAALLPSGVEPTTQTTGDIADNLEELVDRLTRFVTGLALISLLVGAIGIANIMLVSVTERTREIGIMKAVGARNRDVLVLFLVESALLGVLGAVIALPVGLLGGWVATDYADIPMTLAPEWFGVAIVVGIVVGVLAGIYPAWRAARVDPIDALRHE